MSWEIGTEEKAMVAKVDAAPVQARLSAPDADEKSPARRIVGQDWSGSFGVKAPWVEVPVAFAAGWTSICDALSMPAFAVSGSGEEA